MGISAILPCHNDPRVFRCIESLETTIVEYEVVVVLTNVSEGLVEGLSKLPHVKVAWADVGNLCQSLNRGIAASRFDRITILNADCVYSPGYLDQMHSELDLSPLARARLHHRSSSLLSRCVGRLRDYTHRGDVFFCPAVGYRKEIAACVGGYLYDERVKWAEDAELMHRLRKAGFAMPQPSPEMLVLHDEENIRHDLRSAFWIGRGKYLQVRFAGRDPWDESISNFVIRIFTGVSAREFLSLWRSEELPTAFYSILWWGAYYSGFWTTKIKLFCSDQSIMRKGVVA